MDHEQEGQQNGDARDGPTVPPVQPKERAPDTQDHRRRADDQKCKPNHEARLATWTGGLAVITALLVVVTGVGSYAAFEQLRELRLEAPIALAQANAAQTIAKSSEQSVATTAKLVQAAQTQADAALSASKAAQDQAASARALVEQTGIAASAQRRVADIASRAELPVFVPQDFSIIGLKGAPDKDGLVTITYHASMLNAGKGTAHVISGGTEISHSAFLPPFNITTAQPESFDVAPGSLIKSAGISQIKWAKNTVDDVLSGNQFVYFMSKTTYEDPAGKRHYLCYAYRLDTADQDRLADYEAVGGPEYRCEGVEP